MRRLALTLSVSVVLMAAPPSSFAQGLPSDPEADSPSGVVYELPIDRARKDAAPRHDTRSRKPPTGDSGGGNGSGGSTSGGSGTVGGTTSIRSENNFGTSSEVPGAPSERTRSQRRASSADQNAAGGGNEAGTGDTVKRAAAISAATAGTTDGPSDGIVFPLLAAVLAVGAGIGVFASRRALRGRRGE